MCSKPALCWALSLRRISCHLHSKLMPLTSTEHHAVFLQVSWQYGFYALKCNFISQHPSLFLNHSKTDKKSRL